MVHRQYEVGTFKHKLFTLGQQWIDGLLIILILVEFSNSSNNCGPGIYSPERTSPTGEIFIEYNSGTPLEIVCVLNPNHDQLQKVFSDNAADGNKSKLLSYKIRFYRNDERMPEQYVSIINSTAAQLWVPNPPASSDVYKCMVCLDKNNHFVEPSKSSSNSINNALQKNIVNSVESHPSDSHDSHDDCIGVCLNKVFVGYKPFNITNFSCISHNWESLTCNWNKPENPIKTNYKISGSILNNCPTDSDIRNNTCYWDFSTTPPYKQSYEYYNFTITGQNALGKSSTPIRFHHYANIILDGPRKLEVVDRTESSVELSWSLGTMSFYSHGLIYKIQYTSDYDTKWNFILVSDNSKPQSTSNQTISVQGMNHSFNVTGLEYPFADYCFWPLVRTAHSDGEDKWFGTDSIDTSTKPSIPKRPPQIDIGSFEYVISPSDKSKRDIVIYWKTIEEYEKCGESFEYVAYYIHTAADKQITTYHSNVTGDDFAKFNCLSTSIAYEFIVISYNKEGFSKECSRVYVPSESDTLHKPKHFKKNVLDEHTYELSWESADTQKLSTENQLDYYTLFWCEVVLPEEQFSPPLYCNGHMDWIHVPISVTRYNITVVDKIKFLYKNIYLWAISVNSANGIDNLKASSSGMVWEPRYTKYLNPGKIFQLRQGRIGELFRPLQLSPTGPEPQM